MNATGRCRWTGGSSSDVRAGPRLPEEGASTSAPRATVLATGGHRRPLRALRRLVMAGARQWFFRMPTVQAHQNLDTSTGRRSKTARATGSAAPRAPCFVSRSTAARLSVFTTRPDTIFGATMVMARARSSIAHVRPARRSQRTGQVETQESASPRILQDRRGHRGPLRQSGLVTHTIWIAGPCCGDMERGVAAIHSRRRTSFLSTFGLPIASHLPEQILARALLHRPGVCCSFDGTPTPRA